MPEAPRQTRPGQRGDHHQQTKLLDGENAAGGARHGRRGRATVFREPGGGGDAGSLIWLSGGRGRGLGVSPSPLRLCLPPAVRAHRRLVRGKEKRIWATSTARTSCLHLPSMPAADDLARVPPQDSPCSRFVWSSLEFSCSSVPMIDCCQFLLAGIASSPCRKCGICVSRTQNILGEECLLFSPFPP
jgi:hypothetical protein